MNYNNADNCVGGARQAEIMAPAEWVTRFRGDSCLIWVRSTVSAVIGFAGLPAAERK